MALTVLSLTYSFDSGRVLTMDTYTRARAFSLHRTYSPCFPLSGTCEELGPYTSTQEMGRGEGEGVGEWDGKE